jgi:hypothetical protein
MQARGLTKLRNTVVDGPDFANQEIALVRKPRKITLPHQKIENLFRQ